MLQTLEYIAAHYADADINITTIARSIGISEGHLSHVFKKETSYTALGYLTLYRIHMARRLLADCRYKVYEVAGMVGSLLSTEEYLEPADDARKQLKDSAGEVLDAAIAALEGVDEVDWKTDNLHETLNKALVEDGGYKPRLAFGPVRVAMSGRRVSPPLFESMEIVGKPVSLARLKGLREHL